ncbi:MAG: NAD-dependent epimerase/dehydratase family protein, partial [bacterium]|nr:NAD-dependent epimerase/dehydratase family protein [bacterium]
VTAFCLPGTPTDHITQTGVRVVFGDILTPDTLSEPMSGVDLVFHTAGTTAEWHPDPDSVYRINGQGTRNVCQAASDANVKRLIYTSSLAAVGGVASLDSVVDEDQLWNLWDTGLYSRSKYLGESEALRAGARGLDVVVCCPHQILGERDFGPSTPGRIVVLFAQGKIPLYVNAVSQFVDVADCAEGHILAAENGKQGERYILAGSEAVDMRT